MEIDFTKPLTDEAKAYLKANVEKIEEAAGVIAFDPAEPLSRTAMEQLKVRHKIAGKDETFTVWDAAQSKTKVGGADALMQKAGEAMKLAEAAGRIKEALAAGENPDDDDAKFVQKALSDDPAAFLGKPDDGKNKRSKIEDQKSDSPARKVTLADLDPEVRELMFPTKHHGAFVGEQLDAEATRILKETITKGLANDPKRKAVEAKLGRDANKQSIMASFDKMAIDTLDQQARGRIAELRGSGTDGDILGEIPGIVGRFVANMDPQTILDKAAPQAILLGGSSPDDAPLRVLSDEDLSAIPKFDSNWPEAMARRAVQKLAAQQVGATG